MSEPWIPTIRAEERNDWVRQSYNVDLAKELQKRLSVAMANLYGAAHGNEIYDVHTALIDVKVYERCIELLTTPFEVVEEEDDGQHRFDL